MRDALGWLLTYWTIARGMGHLVSLALGHLDASVAVADNLPSPVARIRFAVASLSLFIRANVWCSHALLCVTAWVGATDCQSDACGTLSCRRACALALRLASSAGAP
jgi:hypothetical protein